MTTKEEVVKQFDGTVVIDTYGAKICAALLAVQRAIQPAKKSGYNPHFKS